MSESAIAAQKVQIMYQALRQIAKYNAFFEGEKQLVEIAREALMAIAAVELNLPEK
jgi:hypothetical protein